jgi:hypothetical protein
VIVHGYRGSIFDMQQQMPPKWSRQWIIRLVVNILLGHVTLSLPGWLLIIIAIFIGVPDFAHRFEFWFSVTQSSAEKLSIMANILRWPYFSPTLALLGISYIVAVSSRPQAGRYRQALPTIGWIAATICFVSVLVTAGYGAIEIYIRQEIAKGITGIPRNTPESPNRPQQPAYSQPRGLQPDQVRILSVEFAKLKPLLSSIMITVPPRDNEAWTLRKQFDDILLRAGISVEWGEQVPSGIDDVGLKIAVPDPQNPPAEAERFREALAVANIPATYTTPVVYPDRRFVFYIAPRPLN